MKIRSRYLETKALQYSKLEGSKVMSNLPETTMSNLHVFLEVSLLEERLRSVREEVFERKILANARDTAVFFL
jgi:hypothetical protein